MTKQEFVEKIAEKAELSKKDAAKAVDAFADVVIEALAADDKVNLIGFGTFERRYRAARDGRNPQTGETIRIAESYSPAFKAGKAFKDAVR